jgi:uncharacterized protein (TIGR02246 family)
MRAATSFGLALALAGAPWARAQAPAPAIPAGAAPSRPVQVQAAVDPARAADVQALREYVTAYERAFAAGDAKALASMFTEDAQVSDDVGTTRGRANIEARFARYLATIPKATIAIKVDDLRFLTPDVAIEEGRATVTPAGPGAEVETARYTVVYVKQNGRWLQSSLRDYEAEEPAVPERLKELEWLLGNWVNESPDAVVLTTCHWSDDKHYLLRDFTVTVAGKVAMKGTQRIGWDPAAKQVRSWVFDSDGGFSEGFWTRLGEQWMVKTQGVHHDGRPVSATMMITRISPGVLRWSAFDRTRGSDLIPEVDEFTMVRRPPAPE